MKLCVPVAEPTIERARDAVARAEAGGGFAEVRLDALEGVPALEALAPLCVGRPAELLLTFRRPRDGGRREVGERERIALLAAAARRYGVLCDVEADCAAEAGALGMPAGRLVLSHHDFERTPPDLVALFDRMAERPAAVYKLATRAATVADTFAHFRLLERARATGRRAVAVAMGARGVASRVLGPAWGAAFTFCALEPGRESAPGQPSLDEARDLYRVERLTRESAVTGLAGGRVGYSRSPRMHNGAFARFGIDGVYVPFETDDLGALLGALRDSGWNVRGLSVTNPFKVEVLAHLDAVDPVAERAGAANTVVFDGGRLVGYNTDVDGALLPLEAVAGPLAGLRVAVVGAGGAARALLCGLASRGARATVYARRPEAARDVAARFGAGARPLGDLAGERPDVLVNTTPVGTSGHPGERSPVEPAWLGGVGVVYDLVYDPERTPLLEEAERAGCRTLGGLPMLAAQAALQFELWTGRAVAPAEMLALAAAGAGRSGS